MSKKNKTLRSFLLTVPRDNMGRSWAREVIGKLESFGVKEGEVSVNETPEPNMPEFVVLLGNRYGLDKGLTTGKYSAHAEASDPVIQYIDKYRAQIEAVTRPVEEKP